MAAVRRSRRRLDERARRIIATKGARDDVAFVGWEVDSAAELDTHVKQMKGGGVTVQDGTAAEASFLHMNPRHHSIAYVQAPIPRTKRIHHFMVQCNQIEDMGRAYDRLKAAGAMFGMTIGQHTNDKQVSFYAQTPSGFFMEFGAGGIAVDDATWVPTQHEATSYWGHDRLIPPAPVPVIGAAH